VKISVTLVLLAVALSPPAFAHTGQLTAGGFLSGFSHPIRGWDHVAAMVAVGIWGAYLGPPSIWTLPIVFPTVMAVGGAMGVAGLPVPPVEVMVALSGVVLGLMIVFAVRLPTVAAAVIVGIFAIFHGYAHGQELPKAANPAIFAMGFVLGTGVLHATGICFSLLRQVRYGEVIVRSIGGGICLTGVGFLTGILS
jgi:urease accessory protein